MSFYRTLLCLCGDSSRTIRLLYLLFVYFGVVFLSSLGGEDYHRLRPLSYPNTVSFSDFNNSMIWIYKLLSLFFCLTYFIFTSLGRVSHMLFNRHTWLTGKCHQRGTYCIISVNVAEGSH